MITNNYLEFDDIKLDNKFISFCYNIPSLIIKSNNYIRGFVKGILYELKNPTYSMYLHVRNKLNIKSISTQYSEVYFDENTLIPIEITDNDKINSNEYIAKIGFFFIQGDYDTIISTGNDYDFDFFPQETVNYMNMETQMSKVYYFNKLFRPLTMFKIPEIRRMFRKICWDYVYNNFDNKKIEKYYNNIDYSINCIKQLFLDYDNNEVLIMKEILDIFEYLKISLPIVRFLHCPMCQNKMAVLSVKYKVVDCNSCGQSLCNC